MSDLQSGTDEPQPDAAQEPPMAHGDEHDGPGPAAPPGDASSTGDADIDAALAELDAVRGQPLEAHVAAAERVHRHLRSRLSDLGD